MIRRKFIMIKIKSINGNVFEVSDLVVLSEKIFRRKEGIFRLVLKPETISEANLIKVDTFSFSANSMYIGNLKPEQIERITDEAFLAGSIDLRDLLEGCVEVKSIRDIPKDKPYYAKTTDVDGEVGFDNPFTDKLENNEVFTFRYKKKNKAATNSPWDNPLSCDASEDEEDEWDEEIETEIED
jgi:hypothetical protein